MKKLQPHHESSTSPSTLRHNLSELDFKIMRHVIDDGRKSLTDIAKDLNVSIGTVSNHLTRLQSDGILLVFGQVHPNRIGFNTYAQVCIAVRPANKIDAIAKAIMTIPEVSFVAQISGEFDLEINVMCRDNDHLTSVLNESVYTLEGISYTRTNIYLKIFKVAQPALELLAEQTN
ncbi:MAG: Lrp/AsnC family transcriptional regulator [Calditrichia bacterium]